MPDVISIYRHALCDMCDDEDDLAEEIYVTVIHEIAHAAGIDDERLHRARLGVSSVSSVTATTVRGYGAAS